MTPPIDTASVAETSRAKVSGYRPDVDGLRGLAVLAVVVFHAKARLAGGGFVGVDVFFVISGYLITGILLRDLAAGRFSFRTFYIRRVRRIFPALIIALLVTWALGWFVLLPRDYAALGLHIGAGAGFCSNILLWREAGYFDKSAELKPLLHLWSLGIEEQFYLVWPALLYFARKRRSYQLGVLLVVAFATFTFNVLRVHAHPIATFYMPQSRFWELSLGGVLSYFELTKRASNEAKSSSKTSGVREVSSLVGMLGLAYAMFGLDEHRDYPGAWALLPVAATCLLIAGGPGAKVNRHLLANRALVFVGLISYPLYLFHWPFLCYLKQFPPNNALIVAAVLVAALLAWATYELVEAPIRHGRFLTLGRTLPAVLTSALVLAGGLGFATLKVGGFIQRFPRRIWPLLEFHYDAETAFRDGRCFLRVSQDETSFADECRAEADQAPSEPRVLVWGDSHAAQLVSGIEEVRKSRHFTVIQYSMAACPPLVDWHNTSFEKCDGVNRFVPGQIIALHPQIVILGGDWVNYPAQDILETLPKTLAVLHNAGVPHVVVVGPVPEWESPLPQLLTSYVLAHPDSPVPQRTRTGLVLGHESLDDTVRGIADAGGAQYVSAMNALCTSAGCLTLASDNIADLTSYDYSHLTASGSRVLVEAAFQEGVLSKAQLP